MRNGRTLMLGLKKSAELKARVSAALGAGEQVTLEVV